jgi:hypothetical protein
MARFTKLALLGSARRYAKKNAETVHGGIDRAAEGLSGRIGAKHSSAVERSASFAKKVLTGTDKLPSGEGSPKQASPEREKR